MSPALRELCDLTHLVEDCAGFKQTVAGLLQQKSMPIEGLWGSADSLVAASLAQQAPSIVLLVIPREKDLELVQSDLQAFGSQNTAVLRPWNTLPGENPALDPVFGSRLRLLRTWEQPGAKSVAITTLSALLQPAPAPGERVAATRSFRVGESLDLEEVLAWLDSKKLERVPTIESPGDYCLHGGILDIYSPDAGEPVRIELFGNEIESIRTFDPETQRKTGSLNEVAITLLDDSTDVGVGTAHVLEGLPAKSWILVFDLPACLEETRHYLQRLGDRRGLFSTEATLSRFSQFGLATLTGIAQDSQAESWRFPALSIERFQAGQKDVLSEFARSIARDEHVVIACHNEGARHRLQELFAESHSEILDRITLCIGRVQRGFRLCDAKLVVLDDNELFGRVEVQRVAPRKRTESRAIDSFLDLKVGDLVVHLSHGIARFAGMKILEKGDQKEEHLHLTFASGQALYVPVALIHLVQKYIGGTKTAPPLSKLGTATWAGKKKKVAEAVSDMAAGMLRLQAERELRAGLACPPDSHWQREFEDEFPYNETDDQLRAIADVKDDLQRPRPMDRLICGDVGYGKTEVAIRAAFKMVDAGRQVAVLVPTTVLAEQHLRSFSDRMAEYPVTVAGLSRFRSKAEQREIVADVEAGRVDIVIGTHRLVQKDIKFRDLGLVIVDEEQRFGVEAKDFLKQLRLEVDVLTLSATPIPRTLHLSLVGVRDISNLETPPQDRVAVETHVMRWNDEMIRQAMVRELNRGGQIYFVHNRVQSINAIADELRSIVPEAKVGILHGQMHEDDIEAGLVQFVRAETDILVATTIIESGLDIPNANTMFIHQAEIYGLADLHQLRGRVGRYKNRAYCYLVLDPNKSLTPQASRRLKAIEEYSDLGSGFKIAMRDLEIRGAGNILGTEQSGHISAVGYELYCQLLENAVRAVKREPLREYRHVSIDLPTTAYFPDEYVPPGRLKIEMYRRLSLVQGEGELSQFRDELADRFGPIPEPVAKLLEVRALQLAALYWQIDRISLEQNEYVILGYRNARKIHNLVKQSAEPIRVLGDTQASIRLPRTVRETNAIIDFLREILKKQTP